MCIAKCIHCSLISYFFFPSSPRSSHSFFVWHRRRQPQQSQSAYRWYLGRVFCLINTHYTREAKKAQINETKIEQIDCCKWLAFHTLSHKHSQQNVKNKLPKCLSLLSPNAWIQFATTIQLSRNGEKCIWWIQCVEQFRVPVCPTPQSTWCMQEKVAEICTNREQTQTNKD